MKKRIPIGKEDFKAVIAENSYYIDKTMMLKEIIDFGTAVTLFTRPRRFGKTLNLSMIRRFFEDERTYKGDRIDNGHLFDGLAISDAGEEYLAMQQQFPVIKLSLKSAKQKSFDMAYTMLKKEIIAEYRRHEYILQGSCLDDSETQIFKDIMAGKNDDCLYYDAVRQLSIYLAKYHQKNVIILIDEYDVPLENAYFRGFYDEMIDFIRSLFESALKTNDCMQFGVVTGCLRISKESIFTGLNNLNIDSLSDTKYGEYFGFTQQEIDSMLEYYDLINKQQELKAWYDGYSIGGKEIYNPWSVLNYIDRVIDNPDALPRPYWANTSSNSIIRELVDNADDATKSEMEHLLSGETIEKPIHEDITYEDIHSSMDNLWNFLYFTGYLKNCGERQDGRKIYMKLTIPNMEIGSIYEDVILSWFDEKIRNTELSDLYQAIENGDAESFGSQVTKQLQDTISFFDYAENYYHGFLAGLLKGMPGYRVLSNRESGNGRADLILQESKFMGKAIILELKVSDKFTEMAAKCDEALKQIDANYAQPLIDDGCQEIMKYGICFFKKGCIVKQGK